jgi:hypothetical protein
MAFLCVSQQATTGEFKNTTKHFLVFGVWGSPCQKLLAEKAEGGETFFLSSFPFDFLNRVFGRFSA